MASDAMAATVTRNCVFLFSVGLGPGTKAENVLLIGSFTSGIIPADCNLRWCTFKGISVIREPRVKLFDCILPAVESNRDEVLVENCNVYGKPPFIDQAKPGKGCFSGDPQFLDPVNLDYRLRPTSPCRGRASGGGDVGFRYTPEIEEVLKVAFDLRRRGIIKF